MLNPSAVSRHELSRLVDINDAPPMTSARALSTWIATSTMTAKMTPEEAIRSLLGEDDDSPAAGPVDRRIPTDARRPVSSSPRRSVAERQRAGADRVLNAPLSSDTAGEFPAARREAHGISMSEALLRSASRRARLAASVRFSTLYLLWIGAGLLAVIGTLVVFGPAGAFREVGDIPRFVGDVITALVRFASTLPVIIG